MESSSWPQSLPINRIKAIQELTNGQELTNKLREMLGRPEKIESDVKSVNGVVVQILEMFDNTLSILNSSNINGARNPTTNLKTPCIREDSDESIKTITPVKTKRGCYNRRRNTLTTTKVTSNLIDDGHAWRKYGQKVILNSKYQRNYYRCSHKFEQGCQATKQVQMINDEPSKYKITYSGVHTCNNLQRSPQIIVEDLNPSDNSMMINFETNTLIKKNKVGTCFPSMKQTTKEDFTYAGHLKHKQVSSFDHHTQWDPVAGLSQVSSKPMSMMSSGLETGNMVSPGVLSSTCSTDDYEIGNMTESHDLDDLLADLYP